MRRAGRIPAIDAIRGAAIVLMVVYHLCWDLDDAAIATFDLYGDAFWIGFRSLILIMFLAVVGGSLVLAARNGIDRRRYLRRLALIVGAAALVTASSLVLLPESPIWFGVLQFIAVASVLALPFLRLGWRPLAGSALLVWVASFYENQAFDAPWLRWVGWMTFEPTSSDYVPLLPWFPAVLAGMAIAKLILVKSAAAAWWPTGTATRAGGGALVVAGRHSLLIYLVHQPVLIGLIHAAILVAPSLASYSDGFRESFLQQCRAECRSGGSLEMMCTGYCQCALRSVEQVVPWRDARRGGIADALRPRIEAATRRCLVGK